MTNSVYKLIQALQTLFVNLFQCQHPHAKATEGKTYCPDCGVGLIYQWVTLHCATCNQRRSGQYGVYGITPKTRCCIDCGDTQVKQKVLENPAYFQLRYALLTRCEDPFSSPLLLNPFEAHWAFWVQPLLARISNAWASNRSFFSPPRLSHQT